MARRKHTFSCLALISLTLLLGGCAKVGTQFFEALSPLQARVDGSGVYYRGSDLHLVENL